MKEKEPYIHVWGDKKTHIVTKGMWTIRIHFHDENNNLVVYEL